MDDGRIALAKEKFLKEVLQKTGYKKNNAINEKDLWKITDTFAISNKKIASGNVNENTILFSFNNAKVKVGDWMQYVRNVKNTYAAHANKRMLNFIKIMFRWQPWRIIKTGWKNLILNLNTSYRNLKMAICFLKLWKEKFGPKPLQIVLGLSRYYNEHKTNYKWNASADAVLFSCANETAAKTCN